MHGTDTLRRDTATTIQHEHAVTEEIVDEHAGHNHPPGEHVGHDHSQVETEVVESEVKSIGMKAIDVAVEKKENIENKLETIVDEKKE